MTSQVYTLDGPKEFAFPHPVRRAEQLTLEVRPGGVVPPAEYEVIGASPTATGVTVRWLNAPVSGAASLVITRFTQPDRQTQFEEDIRVTARGLNAEFDNLYQYLEDFSAQYTPERVVQLDEADSGVVSPVLPQAVPFKALIWNDDGTALRNVDLEPSDTTLREQLASTTEGQGASLVGTASGDNVETALSQRVIYVGSVAELEAMSLPVGTAVYLTQEGRAGKFVVKSGAAPGDPQKGLYIELANGNYAERDYTGELNAAWFGLTNGYGPLQTTILQAALDAAKPSGAILGKVVVPPGYSVSLEMITLPQNVELDTSGCTLEFFTAEGITFNTRTAWTAKNCQVFKRVETAGAFLRGENSAGVRNDIKITGYPEIRNDTADRAYENICIDISKFYNCTVELAPSSFGRAVNVSGSGPVYYNDIKLRANDNRVCLYSDATLFNGNFIHLIRANSIESNVVVEGGPDVGSAASGSNTFYVTYAEGTTDYGFDLLNAGGTTIIGGAVEGAIGTTGAGVRLRNCRRTTLINLVFGAGYSSTNTRVIADSDCTGTTIVGGSSDRPVFNHNGAITRIDSANYERILRTSTDETTPDVSMLENGATLSILPPSSPITITNFTGGRQGQTLKVVLQNNQTTLAHSSSGGMRLSGSVDLVTPATTSVVEFVYYTTALGTGAGWIETGRSLK